MDEWNSLLGKFSQHQDNRTKMDLDKFMSKYLILFNKGNSEMDPSESNALLKEYRTEIDPRKPLSIIRNLDGIGDEELVIRLPPMETALPTLNECVVDSSIIDVLYNKMEQHSRDVSNKGVGKVIDATASVIADKSIAVLIKNDQYSEVMDEIAGELAISKKQLPENVSDVEWD